MDFDDAPTPDRDHAHGEVTREIATAALGDAGKAKSEASAIARAFSRYKAIAAAVTAALTLTALGYAYRDQQDHFATKAELEAQGAQVDRNTLTLSHVDDTLQAQREAFNRLTEQVKDLVNLEMTRGRKEERGHGR